MRRTIQLVEYLFDGNAQTRIIDCGTEAQPQKLLARIGARFKFTITNPTQSQRASVLKNPFIELTPSNAVMG